MQSRSLLFVLTLQGLLYSSAACPFHADGAQPAPLNNTRRSLPNACQKTAIENIQVFNGKSFGAPRTICIDDEYLVNPRLCDDAEKIIDGRGKFLLPGLIDSHVHLGDVQGLENLTSYGVTTALQMNCVNYTQCDTLQKQSGLASVLRAGMSAVGNGSLHAHNDPSRPLDTLIYPNTNVTQFTEWQFNNGSNFHKITAEVHGPSAQQQTEMVQVAHKQFHKQTMTHAALVMAYEQAAESKTDGIQHVPDDGLLDAALVRKIKAQRQSVTPTLNIFEYAFKLEPLLQVYFNITPGGNQTLRHAESNAKILYRAGVPMLAGTDAVGPLPIPGLSIDIPFGLTLHYELQNLVNVVGMSPAEAINAATKVPAKWHQIHDRGSIRVGKRADLLMLNSNPLANINNTLDIHSIWAGGVEVSLVSRLGSPST